jgi:general secretion pathway protein D
MNLRTLRGVATVAAVLALPGATFGQSPAPRGAPGVSATILPGAPQSPQAPPGAAAGRPMGDINLNFPAADVRDLAKAVLGDMLGLTYQVAPQVSGSVTLVTPHPIPRSELLDVFEEALAASKLALVRRGGAYLVVPLADARTQVSGVAADQPGFGVETIQLRYVSGAELKKLLDPVVPGTVEVSDPVRNVITVTGGLGQRRAVRQLVGQFDVDWLRGMSFGLYVPRHTDARLIVPEIERLLNGEGSPSAGLVRLIAMEQINGVLAVSAQPLYLQDVQRWIEVLDREGESSEPRLFVYRVQNGRSNDLAKALNGAFGTPAGAGGGGGAGQLAAPTPANSFDLPSPPAQAATPAGSAPSRGGAFGPAAQGAGPAAAVITSDETNNAVLVYGTPREYALIEDALRKLDVPPVQVLIEAAITEVTLTHALQYGVQWNFTKNGSQFNLLPNIGGVTTPSSGIDPTTTDVITALSNAANSNPGFNYFYTNHGSITATLNALSGLTNVNVLSAPKMLVLNNHTASLEVGDQVPVVTASAVSTISNNAPVVNAVDYRDTGVILKVTPRVNSGGLVLLDIAQEVSDVTTTSTSSINSPTIQQRKFATSIAVQDGETIALGGLIKSTHARGRTGVPLLSSIPVLGALAGTKATSEQRTELLILLTPRVVRTAPEADAVTEELRRKIQALEPLQPMKAIRP